MITIFSCASLMAGITGLILAGYYYRELKTWAKMCNEAQIAIAYNNKIQLMASLTDFVQWTRMLTDDEAKRGRKIYVRNKLQVALLRQGVVADTKTTVRTTTEHDPIITPITPKVTA